MNHAGTLRVSFARELAAAPKKSVNECSGPVAWSGVHHHSGGLIDYQQCVVLEDDLDRDVLTKNRTLLDTGYLDSDHLAAHRLVAGALATAIDLDVAVRDQGSCVGPRQLANPGHKQIEADITVRPDGILSNVAQRLALHGGFRNRSRTDNRR